jgi:hypothetical protein
MGGECGMRGRDGKLYKALLRKHEKKRPLQKPSISGSIMLELVLNK